MDANCWETNGLNCESAVMLHMADLSFELACAKVPKLPREQAIRPAEMRIGKLDPTSYIQIVEGRASFVGLLPTSGIAVWWHGWHSSRGSMLQIRPPGTSSALRHQRGWAARRLLSGWRSITLQPVLHRVNEGATP